MERILNENEKIRRAEEIYYKRNNKNINIPKEEVEKTKTYLGSKILLQFIILINIAVIIFAAQNKNYIFKEEFLDSLQQYNVNINEKINGILSFFNTDEQVEDKSNETVDSNAIIVNDEISTEDNILKEPEVETEVEEVLQAASSLDQMDIDVEYLKSSYSFVKPVDGTVSSRFGSRRSEYQNVSGYHTGIDVAAPKGTKIKSAFSGTVSLVSSEGDYGKHIKISDGNVTTVYAHCSKIYVSQGQKISEGQEIGEVGSTGNSTGPHLHFEIRVDDRYIDPAKIIQMWGEV